mmetsp:Transcript_62705/g.116613  ORF Transcript_62705/g.116613 Transcript_62705/m.116613 type:complete len:131 (+) Transcript_62705:138-530(+)
MSFAEFVLTVDAKEDMDTIFHALRTNSTEDGIFWKLGLPELTTIPEDPYDQGFQEEVTQTGFDSCYASCQGDGWRRQADLVWIHPLSFLEFSIYLTPLLLLTVSCLMHRRCKRYLENLKKRIDKVAPEPA